jgi:hypothetical protein
MASQSATTYMTAPLNGDLLATVSASRPTAAERLGGDDGLSCVAANLLDDGTVAMTWRREWELAAAPSEPTSPPSE